MTNTVNNCIIIYTILNLLKIYMISIHVYLHDKYVNYKLCCCCSVTKSCPTLCDLQHTRLTLSFTISRNLLKFMSIELVMLSIHLILCSPLLLLPSIFPSIKLFSNESALHIRWPKYWSVSFSIQSFQWIFRVDFL